MQIHHILKVRPLFVQLFFYFATATIYIERFWRSFKQEEFYLNEYTSVKALRKAIDAYIDFYNHKRWHESLDYKTPGEVFSATAGKEPVDMCTIPSGQTAPFGTCGQVMDNAIALPTT